MGNSTGKVIGVIALMIALGVAGLEVYQLITDSTGSIYIASHEGIVDLDTGYTTLPTNITFDTKQDDLVLFDFTCGIYLDIYTAITVITIRFVLDGEMISSTAIYQEGSQAVDPQSILDSAGMRYYNTTLAPGTHNVTVSAYCDDPDGASHIRCMVLSVSIYK